MNTSKTKTDFCVIGCGRVGTNLAVHLAGQEYRPAAFFSRTRASAQNAAFHAGGGKVFEKAADAAKSCELIFITTPDILIAPVCDQMAADGGCNENSVVFHLSGALSSNILASARKNGAATGSVHPLQAFAPYEPGQASPFAGVNMSIEGSPRAETLGRKIVAALQARPFTIPTEAKTLYHAAAVVASNYLVTLEHFALTLLGQTGLDQARAYEILDPLIQGTLRNIASKGSVDAMTGPVVRGDKAIIARHLADIDKKMPRFSALYRLLGQHTLDIARMRADFPKEADQQISDLLKK
ncbi:MAG TPA: Rossmann-like and DUF2520 domain-containing protein [Desulfotignum sp.]|nr:Rossmann-like and DUF2520 domain-containing protein [Desulfotignum sp.]